MNRLETAGLEFAGPENAGPEMQDKNELCKVVLHFPVLHFLVLHLQRPRWGPSVARPEEPKLEVPAAESFDTFCVLR